MKNEIQELIREFESDIRHAAAFTRGIIVVIDFSDAALKLVSLGRESLPDILQYHSRRDLGKEESLCMGWILFFQAIANEICAQDAPRETADIGDWLAWAKRECEKS
ncbi:MAG: hypothetical protein ACOYUZ_04790 [Patescibacteria group bacterium]